MTLKTRRLLFAGIYLLLIPAFALVYWFMPGQFYHATLPYEAASQLHIKRIERELEGMIQSLYEQGKGEHVGAGADRDNPNWRVRADNIRDLRITPTTLSWTQPFQYWLGVETKFLHVRISLDINSYPWDDGDNLEKPHLEIEPDAATSELFPTQNDRVALQKALIPDWGSITFPHPFMERVRAYAHGLEGQGSEIDGNLVRMIYLSAVTVTTLGFGDIVPLTTLARVLISLESVLGIVFIGLFLNSLGVEKD